MNCKYKRETPYWPATLGISLGLVSGLCFALAALSPTTTGWLGFGLLGIIAAILSTAFFVKALAIYTGFPCGGVGREIDVFSQED